MAFGIETGKQLYEAALKADEAFQTALVEAFGKDAGEARYMASLPSNIAILRIEKRKADQEWLMWMRGVNVLEALESL
jgi:hypothetical protein